MRLQKFIADSGYCSRRKAEDLITGGQVFVNDKLATIGDTYSEGDTVLVQGHAIKKAKTRYVLLYKPRGYVTALSDQYEKTIAELIPGIGRLYPAGRLDKDAEGLLLVTNNGDIANKIMHPSFEIEKTYVVKTYTEFPKEFLVLVNKYGVVIKDGWLEAKIKKKGAKTYEVKIHVGYHKVVKKIFDNFGVRVQKLVRTGIGNVELANLKPGKHKLLSDSRAMALEKYVNSIKPKRPSGIQKKKREYFENFKKCRTKIEKYVKPDEDGEIKNTVKPKRPGKNRRDAIRPKRKPGVKKAEKPKFSRKKDKETPKYTKKNPPKPIFGKPKGRSPKSKTETTKTFKKKMHDAGSVTPFKLNPKMRKRKRKE